jgi:hypothetical protein
MLGYIKIIIFTVLFFIKIPMAYSNRFGSFWSIVMILWIILIFQPFQVANAQEKGKFNLGPQLIPLEAKQTVQFTYTPWPQALVSNCANSDFSYGDWTGWTACYGFYTNSCQFPGFQKTGPHPLHRLIPGPGWLDYNTCDTLINVFPGESFAAKLGDTFYSNAAAKAAELKYQVNVSSDSYLFIYRYAVVLQTGGHTPPSSYQPDFQVMDGIVASEYPEVQSTGKIGQLWVWI